MPETKLYILVEKRQDGLSGVIVRLNVSSALDRFGRRFSFCKKARVMERIAFLMRIKEGEQHEYIRRHQDVWPSVTEELRRAGISKMAIYMQGCDLFLYMEVEDYAKAVQILTKSPAALRWEEYMAPIMDTCNAQQYDPSNPFPSSLREVFFWDRLSVDLPTRPPMTSEKTSS